MSHVIKKKRRSVSRRYITAATVAVFAVLGSLTTGLSPVAAASGPESHVSFQLSNNRCAGDLWTGMEAHTGKHKSVMRVAGWCKDEELHVMYRDSSGRIRTASDTTGSWVGGGNIALQVAVDGDVIGVYGFVRSGIDGSQAYISAP